MSHDVQVHGKQAQLLDQQLCDNRTRHWNSTWTGNRLSSALRFSGRVTKEKYGVRGPSQRKRRSNN